MLALLDKIPEKAYVVIAYGIGIGFTLICAAAGVIIVRSSSFSYTDKDTQINLNSDRIKKISNDTEYANKQLQEQLSVISYQLSELKEGENIEPLKKSIEELKPVAEEIEKSTDLLKDEIAN